VSSQVLTPQSSGLRAFTALLRSHATATRRLSAQLLADHALTISDYEVLLRLANAPEKRMRRVDLAEQVYLSASGVTRLLDGLERAGYVERASCSTDRRVVYAVLTDQGDTKLREARATHRGQVEEHFSSRLSGEELEQLRALLDRLGDGEDAACDPVVESV
jgi:DNA-binding MarR family transcriptional regulator